MHPPLAVSDLGTVRATTFRNAGGNDGSPEFANNKTKDIQHECVPNIYSWLSSIPCRSHFGGSGDPSKSQKRGIGRSHHFHFVSAGAGDRRQKRRLPGACGVNVRLGGGAAAKQNATHEASSQCVSKSTWGCGLRSLPRVPRMAPNRPICRQ